MCDSYQPVTQSDLLRYNSLQFLYFLLFVFFSFHFFTDLIEERMGAYSSHLSRITATQQERLNSKRNSKWAINIEYLYMGAMVTLFGFQALQMTFESN